MNMNYLEIAVSHYKKAISHSFTNPEGSVYFEYYIAQVSALGDLLISFGLTQDDLEEIFHSIKK